MQHALVSDTRGSRLICIYPRNDEDLVLNLLPDLGQAVHIVQNRFLIVRRAGADDEQELVAPAGEDPADLLITLLLCCRDLGGNGELFLQFLRCR